MRALAAAYLAVVLCLTAAILYGPAVFSALFGGNDAPAPDAGAQAPRMVEALPVEDPGKAPDKTPGGAVAEARPAAADAMAGGMADGMAGGAGGDASAALAAVVSAATRAGAEGAVAAPGATHDLVVRGGKASLGQTTAAILADLAIVEGSGGAEDKALAAMSLAAVAGLRGARGIAGDGRVETLETLVSAALREGRPDTEIDAIVNEAAALGGVSVPAELVTAEGRVDTAILLASLVTQAQIASGLAAPVAPGPVAAGGAGVERQLVTQADGSSAEVQVYTVSPGDSLGAIARRFYGDAVFYSAIFDANRTVLPSPDQLSVGQRLVIPEI